MENCQGYIYAEWFKTKTGKLHPHGDGKCLYEYKVPTLPQSRYWMTDPRPLGGYINRKDKHKSPCIYYKTS